MAQHGGRVDGPLRARRRPAVRLSRQVGRATGRGPTGVRPAGTPCCGAPPFGDAEAAVGGVSAGSTNSSPVASLNIASSRSGSSLMSSQQCTGRGPVDRFTLPHRDGPPTRDASGRGFCRWRRRRATLAVPSLAPDRSLRAPHRVATDECGW